MKLICTPRCAFLYSDDQYVISRSVDVLDQMVKRVENDRLLELDEVEIILRFLYLFAEDRGRERSIVEALENALRGKQTFTSAALMHRLIDLMRDRVREEDRSVFENAERAQATGLNNNIATESRKVCVDALYMDQLQSLERKYVKFAA